MKASEIKRNIDTLRESIRLDWEDLAKTGLTASDRNGLIKHVKWCVLELNALILAFEMADLEGENSDI
jgi:hypothetical protein